MFPGSLLATGGLSILSTLLHSVVSLQDPTSYDYNITSLSRARACNSRIVYMLYDDELYMLKSNKIYVMFCYVIKGSLIFIF